MLPSMPLATMPRGALAPPRSQGLFHFFVENLFNHFSQRFPNRRFQPCFRRPAWSSPLRWYLSTWRIPPVPDSPPEASRVSSFKGFQENAPSLLLQESGQDLPDGARAASGSDGQIIILNTETGDEWGSARRRKTATERGERLPLQCQVEWSAALGIWQSWRRR